MMAGDAEQVFYSVLVMIEGYECNDPAIPYMSQQEVIELVRDELLKRIRKLRAEYSKEGISDG